MAACNAFIVSMPVDVPGAGARSRPGPGPVQTDPGRPKVPGAADAVKMMMRARPVMMMCPGAMMSDGDDR